MLCGQCSKSTAIYTTLLLRYVVCWGLWISWKINLCIVGDGWAKNSKWQCMVAACTYMVIIYIDSDSISLSARAHKIQLKAISITPVPGTSLIKIKSSSNLFMCAPIRDIYYHHMKRDRESKEKKEVMWRGLDYVQQLLRLRHCGMLRGSSSLTLRQETTDKVLLKEQW